MRVALVTHGSEGDVFWDRVRKGAEAAAARDGIELTYLSDPDGAGQADLVRQAVRDGVDGIALTLAKPQAMKGPVNEARAADIPVVGLNSGLDSWKKAGLLAFFGQDESLAGRAVGEKLNDLKAEHTLCVVHERGNVGLEARCAGVKKTFRGTTENLYVDGTDERAVSGIVTARLRQDPTIDQVVTNGADFALRGRGGGGGGERRRRRHVRPQRGPGGRRARRHRAVRRRPAALPAGLPRRGRAAPVPDQRQRQRRRGRARPDRAGVRHQDGGGLGRPVRRRRNPLTGLPCVPSPPPDRSRTTMSPRTGARRRLGSIRLSLILLALVPCVTLAALWGLTTIRMFSEGLELRSQTQLSRDTGAMGTHATLALQRERRLTAAWLAGPGGSRSALDAQRRTTDGSVARLMGQADAIAEAPARVSDRLYSVLGSVGSLEYYRDQIDGPRDITAEEALEQYTSIIDDQIHAFQELSQVDDGDLTSQAQPLVALEHAAELVSREDALLTLAWPSGRLDAERRQEFAALVHTRRWLVGDQIVPSLSGGLKTQAEEILQSPAWRALEAVEDQVLATPAEGRRARPSCRT